MFEGFVSQILLGFIGQYVKGFQKDQLKIGLWREEVLLEKVELISEAFDYLQLPFRLKNGRVGKLSIKLPWKKLGWEPIVIALEDVFICACQREESEWSSDSMERRELAGKMAKLNAIELAKFSRRVSDNPAGQSFLSYIYAKILDNIQVSIRNVHIIYVDSHNDLGNFIFGLRLSTLSIMTDTWKQNSTMPTIGKSRSAQVNKIVEISDIGFYCNILEGDLHSLVTDETTVAELCTDERYDYLVNPFDVSVSLQVSKSGKLDGSPQYSIIAELTTLVASLSEIQLKQVLGLFDYFSICTLREKYGRYRPPQISLSLKLNGWQRMWWHYAQESVLADVRRKLKKASGSNLGRRIIQCLRYADLYKRKLELLQQEQVVHDDILNELEKMDKECDIDDILNFRCLSEQKLQEGLKSSSPITASNDSISVQEKLQSPEHSASRARGWLNWLSLGMLGAGGTADSSSFAGVVSDEIIKDIYDATDFHPVPSFDGDSLVGDKFASSNIKINISQIVITISTRRNGQNIAQALFSGIGIECKVWKESIAILALTDSVKIMDHSNDKIMLIAQSVIEESSPMHPIPFINVQVDMALPNQNSELSVKIVVQPFEATFELDFFMGLFQFFHIFLSFQFQYDRVLLSLNGFGTFESRLLSKAEYLSFTRKTISWDIYLHNVLTKFPLQTEELEDPIVVLQVEGISFKSRNKMVTVPQILSNGHCYNDIWRSSLKDTKDDKPLNFLHQDLYDHFDIYLSRFEVYLYISNASGTTPIIEKISASIGLGLCIFLDEPTLKAVEVDFVLPFVGMHFSPTIFDVLVGVHTKFLPRKAEAESGSTCDAIEIGEPENLCTLWFSVSIKLDQLCFHVYLAEEASQHSNVSITLANIDARYAVQEYLELFFLVKFLKVEANNIKGESNNCTLLRNGSPSVDDQYVAVSSLGIPCESSVESCLKISYNARRDGCVVYHESSASLNDLELHVYPKIFGLLQIFFDTLTKQSLPSGEYTETPLHQSIKAEDTKLADVELPKFRHSNLYGTEAALNTGTSMENFPFVTIQNSGSLSNLEGSLVGGDLELQSSYGMMKHPRTLDSKRKHRISNYANVRSPFKCGTDICNVFLLEINLDNLHAHFHDSSCILGTITLPKSRSFLSYHEAGYWDTHISTDGLILSSSWSPTGIHECLWGPASSCISPILDIRLRKQKDVLTPIEISIGIQNVICILPADFLAMIFGYFSLPWTSQESVDINSQCKNNEFENVQDTHTDLLYKVEILNSRLILPVESHTDVCLQIKLPRLYCCVIPMCSSVEADMDIHCNCLIPTHPTTDRVDVINLFGRSLSLSVIPLGNDGKFILKAHEHSTIVDIPLIERLDADLWIRLPCKTEISGNSAAPTVIMMKSDVCNFIVEDKYLSRGIEAILSAVDELSSVGKDYLIYNFDVLQFLHVRRNLKEATTVTVDIPNETIVKMKLCGKAFSVKFSYSGLEQTTSPGTVAKSDFELNFFSSFERGIPQQLDVHIPRLLLYSFLSNLPLVSFVCSTSISSQLCIKFLQSDQGDRQLLLEVPALDIWLHLSEWYNFIEFFGSYVGQSSGTSVSCTATPRAICEDVSEPHVLPCSAPESIMHDAVILAIKSVNTSVSIHLPIFDDEENLARTETNETANLYDLLEENMSSAGSKHQKFVKFTLQSRHYEVTVGQSYMKLKFKLEKLRVILEMIQNEKITSIPFIQISQLKVDGELHKREGELMHALIEVKLESLDVGLSYQILNFFSCSCLKLPARTSRPTRSHCIIFKLFLQKGSLLLSDGRWSYHGPILEILTKNAVVQFKQTEEVMEGSANADIVINYNNIDKVMWEPFVEPSSLQLNFVRKYPGENILNPFAVTDIYLESREHLNLNITEPLIEAIFRVKQMIDDALNQKDSNSLQEGNMGCISTNHVHTKRYAPYILRNDTSLPLTFHVSHGPICTDDVYRFSMKDVNIAQPGHTIPIYVEETFDEHYSRHRAAYSSERLLEKKMTPVAHHMISVQLEGTTGPSKPMSMDLVGLSYFEVSFSNNQQLATTVEVDRRGHYSGFNQTSRTDQSKELLVPVVFEVSVQHYSKMIRLYSTVLLHNATSMPLELRFDIPFGVSSKVLGPILSGQEIPLPLHLASSGRMSWHPLGNNYLWSEAHSLSNILSQENRLGFLRSSVCYPTNPTSNLCRCCISIQDYSLSPLGLARKHSCDNHASKRATLESADQRMHETNLPRKNLLRQVRFTTPLLVKNYLPTGLSLLIESSGVTHSISLLEVNTASVYHVDSTHDLGITFHIQGFSPVTAKFPRAESFCSLAKINGSKFYSSETLSFYPEISSGPTYVNLEKAMDEFCGAREVCLSVPFLLYNCTGLLLTIISDNQNMKGSAQVIPPSYQLIGDEHLSSGKEGIQLLSSESESFNQALDRNIHTISTRESANFYLYKLSRKHFPLPHSLSCNNSNINDPYARETYSFESGLATSSLHSSRKVQGDIDHKPIGSSRDVRAHMYSPFDHIPSSDVVVKVCTSLSQSRAGTLSPAWSSLFPLAPASGSTNVVIPEQCGPGAFLVSATSFPVAGELSGRTRAVTFQPRYVICNACSKDLCYKQKGTNAFYHLGVGRHSHLHWSDTRRELCVSIRFNEPGWQWSGSFLPDFLGDVQVKMHNYVSGTSNMVRVEVQNADISICDEKMKNSNANCLTHLILLSDDNTGFMPYRIDNFTMERLRIYQQRCEPFETSIHSYTSSDYAWDEPGYPHRLVVEVPGERILGTYSLDTIQEYPSIYLSSTSEKPERRLHVSIHAEGAIKVLSVIDSRYHNVEGSNESTLKGFRKKKTAEQTQGCHDSFCDIITLHFPFIGISLINSSPQELVFACMKEVTFTVMQSSTQQKFLFQILEMQIDNQLSDTLYPILLSFDNEHKGRSTNFLKNKEYKLRIRGQNADIYAFENTSESVFHIAVSKWRNIDASLVSFQYINLGLAPLCIELEEQIFLSLFDFYRTVSSRLGSKRLQKSFEMRSLDYGSGVPRQLSIDDLDHKLRQYNLSTVSQVMDFNTNSQLLPSIIPIGAPWQQIYLSARRQKKIYVEMFELAPIKLSFSFSSTPWMIRNEVHAEVENFTQVSSTSFQRALMALVDVEGVPVHLGELILGHLMASHDSIQDIVVRHYTRQLLHEIYKVFGSAGVIGNPMGFARNIGLGIRDFFSVPSKGIMQSPVGLLTGMLQGSRSLLSNTVYAVSSATTQFSKAAHKGIVAFTFDEQAVADMDVQLRSLDSHGKGILNEFLEGLTGLLQSPIRGAEKHGLPGILSGIVMGTAGLVARPMASIFEATGKTAQSIRNRSSPHQSNRLRIRFPRPLARELPLLPYSWEEAIGVSMLLQADDCRLKDETFVMCKALKQSGKFIIFSEKLVFVVYCSCLAGLGSSEFLGVPAKPKWVIEAEMGLESTVHLDRTEDTINIVGSNAEETVSRRQKKVGKIWTVPTSSPLFCIGVELPNPEEAEDVLQVLLSTVEQEKERRWGMHVLHRRNLR